MSAAPDSFRELTEELESAAARLRAGDLDGDQAAALVERCAELAGSITAALEREARGLAAQLPLDEAPEQERLL